MSRQTLLMLVVCGVGAVAGCNDLTNMRKQPKVRTYAQFGFFEDGAGNRTPVEGTIDVYGNVYSFTPNTTVPPRPEVTPELLAEGQTAYSVTCVVCHGLTGEGDGRVVQRGFPQPPSYHTQRLRTIPDEHIYRVITLGLGKMPSYAKHLTPEQRWAVIEYVRVLQLSQNARFDELPVEEQTRARQQIRVLEGSR